MSLAQRLSDLKKKIGGCRELQHYEESFGLTVQEEHGISGIPAYLNRILSETEFAIHLTDETDHHFDSEVSEALTFLEKAVAEHGSVTTDDAAKAEQLLMPIAETAKSYKLILAGHAHIDMNWMWSFTETVASAVSTFQTMLRIMDEYPDFCFSQSQTSVYKIVDQYAPSLHDAIKKRIDEGRWEVNACEWVESDHNMPNTESLLRHITCSRKYLKKNWGLTDSQFEVGFSPDTFGHPANLSEIWRYGNVKYMYHCRGYDGGNALYRWRGQSGKELLVYREQYWYNSGITPRIAMGVFDVAKRSGGLKTGLIVYGVGDHGGGPTRRDVEHGLEMMKWPVFPTIKFGTFREYFLEAESVREKLEVVDEELNFNHMGCYTTQSRIKRGNRRCEAALSEAENAGTFSKLAAGGPDISARLEEAWEKVLFNQFHDILTGSCVQDTREYAMGLYQKALATANTETDLALRRISDRVDTSMIKTQISTESMSEGGGVGFAIDEKFAGRSVAENGTGPTRIWQVFNNTFIDKEEPVEIVCWDYPGETNRLKVTDVSGNPLPFQVLDKKKQHYWTHYYFRFLVYVKIPALSYKTVVLSLEDMQSYPLFFQTNVNREDSHDYILDNGLVRTVIDYEDGSLTSFKDLATGREYIPQGQSATLEYISTDRHTSSAWYIGKHFAKEQISRLTNIHDTSRGELRCGVAFEADLAHSKFTVEYTLDKGSRCLAVHVHADWHEIGGDTIPVLAYEWPLSYDTDSIRYDIAAGSIVRRPAEEERPGHSYVSALAEGIPSATVIAATKYGFRAIKRDGNVRLISTLINSSVNPDPYPERGIHDFTLYLGLLPDNAAAIKNVATSVIRPATAVSSMPHKGDLAPEGTLLSWEGKNIVLSALFSDEKYLYVRAYSLSDKPEKLIIRKEGVSRACTVDLSGARIGSASVSAGGTVSATVAPRSLITVRMTIG
ncbi:MAG: hypothetical protein IJR83_01285 [Clostridia bacterium]|nr:hypothetical protein [Clostridia bacterium]